MNQTVQAMAETVVAGIPIPSTSPVFLAGVAVHVALALMAIASGAAAMLSRKGSRRHRRFGLAYFWCLAGVALTATALAIARWAEDKDKALFVLALLAFGAALFGRGMRRWTRPGWVRPHLVAMGLSYVIMLTAFYVDNGPSLPVWRSLPPITYWTLPALVGLPIIIATLLRHPLARKGSL
jgi:uncharacterized membrane protein